jgi:hypothetical protein
LAAVNPLKKARWRTTESLRTARDGTTRTVGWVKDGVVGGARKSWRSATGVVRRGGDEAAAAASASGESSNPFGGLVASARENPRVAIAWAAVALLVLAWIGWTVYVWIENGSTAGVGVLISWPAAIAALALIASPFVAATLLVKRLSADGGPQMAGAAGIADAPAEKQPAAGESADAEDEAEENDEAEEDAADIPADEGDAKDDAAA